MKIVIIGSGNVASVLGKAIKSAGHYVLQVYSRNMNKAKILANELSAEPIDDLLQINLSSDIFLIALSDVAIPEIVKNLHFKNGVVLHTAGSVPKNVLENSASNYGVLYPLQSLRKERTDYKDIPLLVDCSSADIFFTITEFAKTISSSVAKANDEERLKLHVSAVIVSNFTNYLYTLAEDYCTKENIPFNMLQPLIEETANRLQNHHAVAMQTGPAARKDFGTIEKHVQLLKSYPDLQAVYTFLSKKIVGM